LLVLGYRLTAFLNHLGQLQTLFITMAAWAEQEMRAAEHARLNETLGGGGERPLRYFAELQGTSTHPHLLCA
jgi:hypothetical protein